MSVVEAGEEFVSIVAEGRGFGEEERVSKGGTTDRLAKEADTRCELGGC